MMYADRNRPDLADRSAHLSIRSSHAERLELASFYMGDNVAEVPEYDLLKTPEEMVRQPLARPSLLMWTALLVLGIAIGLAVYMALGRRQQPTPLAQASTSPQQPAQPLGGDAMPVTVPPLDESDAVVRELVKQISSHPAVAAWLATNGLIRNFTVVVVNVADGNSPTGQLQVLRPSSRFSVAGSNDDMRIDTRSYDRFNDLAAAAASLDPAGSARLYATLKPRIEEANRELGLGNTPFDQTLERAIVQLLRTPVVERPIRVVPRGGVGYAFTDEELQSLTPGQKQLLRTGPRNVRIIQTALRNLAIALGIPADRLPVPHS